MIPNPEKLLEIAGIDHPLIGYYDVQDPGPFEPFTEPGRCIFSSYPDWMKGYSIKISKESSICGGGKYWIGGIMPEWALSPASGDRTPIENFGRRLNRREGFKSSDQLMCQWLENLEPYTIKNGYVVIGPVKEKQFSYLETVTFYVNPDQLSLLIHGAEYNNASTIDHPVVTAFGSGCGQLAALFGNTDSEIPRAVIGATDMAMREHMPYDMLAFTVNKSMYRQLCKLGEDSFLHKHFWARLRSKRKKEQ